ncbi:hypothetical protein ACWD3Z_27435 [Streptomyces sp. NPDC002740]
MRAAVDPDRPTAIDTITAQLASLTGTQPRVTHEVGAVRIETDVTADALRRWEELLAVLDLGTTFGLSDTDTGQIAWLSLETGETFRS